MCLYTCTYVYMYICVYIYTYIYICYDALMTTPLCSVLCIGERAAPEASWRRVFDPCTPLLFDSYHYLEQNGYF